MKKRLPLNSISFKGIIIIINKNNTVTAPTYTIINKIPIKYKLKKPTNIRADTMNKLTNHKIECIADRTEITKKARNQFTKTSATLLDTQLSKNSNIIIFSV